MVFHYNILYLPTRFPGAEAICGKQHPSAWGEEGEKGTKPEARVEHDGNR